MHFKRTLVAMAALLLTTACSAQSANQPNPPYTNGDQYVTISSPQRYSDQGKVEVVEVFSYGCIHCAHFAPYMEKLRQSLPDDVAVHYIPADFNRQWEPYARAFYAAKQLGVVKSTHLAVFKAKFDEKYPMNSLQDFANFYARHGVDPDAFLKAAHSARTDQQLARNNRLIQQWKIMGTPAIVVDGKYRSAHIENFEQLVAMTKWLVQRELKAKQH
ncbi:MAG TPA: thiol:disulfide interchange protein DsbA/DsbL [Oleiagrimonas sp.]|nr:thiol:disulfide interchange protein DsbA/DsbL [Oleiagrimonas sp.]